MAIIETTTEWNLLRRRKRALRELRELLLSNVMRGTVAETTRRCGKTKCGCATDETKRHRRTTLSVNLEGRTRTVHLNAEHLAGAKEATGNYRRLWKLLDEVTEVNLALLRFPAGQSK